MSFSELIVLQLHVEQRIAFQQKRINLADYSQKNEFLMCDKIFSSKVKHVWKSALPGLVHKDRFVSYKTKI